VDVLHDLSRGPCETGLVWRSDRSAPASLVEAIDRYVVWRRSKCGEEVVVGVDVIGEAVKEDQKRFGFSWGVGLRTVSIRVDPGDAGNE